MRKGMSFAEAGRLGAQKSRKRTQQKKQERIAIYDASPKRCENCKKAIPYEKRENRYCGHSCSATINNQRVSRNYKTGQTTKKPCLHCGTATLNPLFCSIKCHKQHAWNKTKSKIKSTGNANANESIKSSWVPKRYLLETRGRQCEICKRKNWNRKEIPIVLDHISGNSTDWSLTNLRLICPNCDAQTDTYKNKNRGNGRHSRRQRYNEGKSY